jgi:hypothetical protein
MRTPASISFDESESDCEEKDPTYVPPRSKNRRKDEFEEWDEELFRKMRQSLDCRAKTLNYHLHV